jgi:hypothetical protein
VAGVKNTIDRSSEFRTVPGSCSANKPPTIGASLALVNLRTLTAR